jgi:membrane-bound lytic murein transglycosylase A
MVTKHARYVAAEWSTLTDWTADASDEALAAFLRGCRSLGPKPPWTAVCADGRKLVGKSRREAREFFEAHFDAYQLRSNTENSDTGLLTGYFEPVVRGSRTKQPGLEVPVYAKPRDLLLLDRKQLIGTRFGAAVTAVVSGGVLTLPRDEAPSQPTADFVNRVRLMLPPDVPATADRKLRVRIDGDTLVPYFSRQELRGRETLDAEVLAWVETEDAVYLMQMQGCGRILFQDGTHLRVGYADQNGHTFAPQGREGLASKGVGTGIPLTATAAPGSENAEVLRIIEMFRSAAGPEPTQPYRPATLSPRHTGNDQPLVTTPTRRDETSPRPNDVPAGLFASAIRSDPSYVFFRRIGPHEPGPIGALGVGLTPERSIAVDPRTTPLGSPVFMSAEGQTSQKLRRLVVAQDTGGAIRGAVRADFYWGPGSIAGARALQTRDPLRLWVLLPKSMRGSMHRLAPLVSKGALDQSPPSECLVADDEFCLE